MKKVPLLSYGFYLILFFVVFSCSRKNTPLSPEGVPTLTPTIITSPTGTIPTPGATLSIPLDNGVITLNLPASATGKNYYIYVFDTFTGFSDADAVISGICGTEPSNPYSLNLPAGNYYMVAYIDNDNNGIPSPGDYVGVYDALWPEWPTGATMTITDGENINCSINLVTGSANLIGRVNLYETAPGKSCQIFLDVDTDYTNSNYIAYTSILIWEGILSVDFSLLVLVPGNYYIYAGVDMDNSGLPFSTPDQFGYKCCSPCGCNPLLVPWYYNAIIPYINSLNDLGSFNISKL